MKIVKSEGVYSHTSEDINIACVNGKWYYVQQIGMFRTGYEDEWFWRVYGDAPKPEKIKLCESGTGLIDYVIMPDNA